MTMAFLPFLVQRYDLNANCMRICWHKVGSSSRDLSDWASAGLPANTTEPLLMPERLLCKIVSLLFEFTASMQSYAESSQAPMLLFLNTSPEHTPGSRTAPSANTRRTHSGQWVRSVSQFAAHIHEYHISPCPCRYPAPIRHRPQGCSLFTYNVHPYMAARVARATNWKFHRVARTRLARRHGPQTLYKNGQVKGKWLI